MIRNIFILFFMMIIAVQVPLLAENPTTSPNPEILNNLMKISTDAWKEINDLLRFVGFGILIAIFYMESNFRTQHKALVLWTSGLTSLSLFLNYIGCISQYRTSKKLLRENNASQLQYEYVSMTGRDECLFTTIQVILMGAIVLFGILAYKYFFYKEENAVSPRSSKNKIR